MVAAIRLTRCVLLHVLLRDCCRLLSYLCGQEVPPRSTAPRLEQQQQQGNEAPNPNPAAFDKSKLDAVVSEEVQKRRAREKADKAQENMA
jgi:hypothetical protein